MLLCLSAQAFAESDTIRSIDLGSPMYDPNELNVTSGDTVVFVLDMMYNAREVSFENWSNNNATGLPGGFSIPYGGGSFVPSPGIHYYICESETTMKGIINVGTTTAGIADLSAFQPEVYPNPAKQLLYISSPASTTVTSLSITDLSGRTILTKQIALNGTVMPIEVADLPRGLFIVTLSDGTNEKTTRLVLD